MSQRSGCSVAVLTWLMLAAAPFAAAQIVGGNPVTESAFNSVNALSREVGGRRVVDLHAQKQRDGDELQMVVDDDKSRRWILGVEWVSGKPSTRICINDGLLCPVIQESATSSLMLYREKLSAAAVEAINADLKGQKARIVDVQIEHQDKEVRVKVSWTRDGDEGTTRLSRFQLDGRKVGGP